MAKKTAEDTEETTPAELPAEVPAVPVAEEPAKTIVVLATVEAHNHDGNFSGGEAAKYLSRLGVNVKFTVDADTNSRSLVVLL